MITFYPRPNTQDSFIIKEVYEDNCYNLPSDMSNIVVIDIGANIGAFVAACVERGVERIYSFEPEKENFFQLSKLCLVNNYKNVELFNFGVTYKAGMRFVGNVNYLGDIALTGGFHLVNNLIKETGQPVSVMSPFWALFQADKDLKESQKIWIKLDCEGHEHEIIDSLLVNQVNLTRVSSIFGEVHTTIDNKICSIGPEVNFTLPSIEDFKSKLEQLGFNVTLKPHEIDPHLALFWAEKV